MAITGSETLRAANKREIGKLLKCGVSLGAVCTFALALPAQAQTGAATGQGTAGSATPAAQPQDGATTQPTIDAPQGQSATTAPAEEAGAQEIVVTGIRQSLANAQNIKRNADTVVDAITAQDIGALPDRSVTEALQRVPGVSINRFAGSNDPDHFSVEGSGVVVRGLNFVRSEFNGRSAFAAGIGGQALNFADVPAELLGSVEIYKNATADLIEGGLAGTVNLNTRKPFDNRGFHIGGGVEANYGDFRKKWTPTASILVSDTFETGIGTFGILGNLSYSRIKSRADGIQVTNIQTRDGGIAQGANGGGLQCRNPLPGTGDTTTLPPAGTCGFGGTTPGADGFADLATGPLYAPLGGQFRTQDFDRKRQGQALALQWESTDKRTQITAQFLRSHSTNAWGERTFESAPDLAEYNTYPFGCLQNTNGPNGGTRAECPAGAFQNYQYGDDGLFQKGYITLPGTGWRQADSGQATTTVPTGGIQQSLSRRQIFEENEVRDYGFNLKHELNDRLSMNLDVDFTQARRENLDFSVFGSTFADQELDLTGRTPVVIPHKPLTLAADWATPNPTMVAASDADYFRNRDFQFWRAAMDHIEDSRGSEYQIKGDFTYKFDDGSFLNRIKFGARYSERQQTVKYSTYNWGNISETWNGGVVNFNQGDTSRSEFFDFPNFFRGATPGPIGGYYYNGDLIKDYQGSGDYFQSLQVASGWVPLANRQGALPGSSYRADEIQPVNQQDSAAYAMLNFGSEDPLFGGIRVSGNIGVRYVATNIRSAGAIGVPTQQALSIERPFNGTPDAPGRCDVGVPEGAPPGTPPSRPGGICNLGPDAYARLQQFANGATSADTARPNYDYFLPSFNLKLGLSRDLIARFAVSKVLTRPDLANIRNFLNIGSDPNTGALTATAGNPFLKPATAWQFDATLEWYFARVGSLTINAFYKAVDNFFYQAITTREITNNGVTFPVLVRGPANFDGTGKIKGVEVSYQQTFDFLPGLLNGFGFNGNYSYIDSSGLPNSFLNGGLPSNSGPITPGNLPLEGLSKHNVNATIFYEKGPVSLRAAYNWRSRFLLTAADVIFPFTSIFNDETGQLDASAFVNLNKYIKIGVQGVNLTNETTRTLQAYTGDPNLLAPRSYFINDRRFSFILRGNF